MAEAFPYLILDARYERVREAGGDHRQAVLIAIGVVFTADGRMMSVVCDGRPELPAESNREYGSYCGNYAFDGTRLITRVDAASDPVGSAVIRCAGCVSRAVK